jgi:small conductance mechanosensitive channel
LHIISNGDIRALTNLTEDWARVVITFNLEHEADLLRVLEVLRIAATESLSLSEIKDDLLEEPEVGGWVGLTDWAVQARLMVKVKPGQQWKIATALRPLALNALHAAGIQLAIPRQSIHLSGDLVGGV